MSRTIEIRPGLYYDSVTLMLLSQNLSEDAAVTHALVAMGTELNLALLTDAGYELPDASAGDLVIAFTLVDGAADGDAERVQALVGSLLTQSNRGNAAGSGGTEEAPARSVGHAAHTHQATVSLISVPGAHAFTVAMEAIEAGTHPVVFSDNVSIEHEIAMKTAANAAGLVAMGPDCGTVILAGAGLGFANAVVPGPIGLVSASGTGAQQVCALADQAGVGVRHVIGLGGRDLSDEVGGLSALPALRLLDADPDVTVIGIVAKSIGPATAAVVDAAIAELSTPTVMVGVDDLTAGTAALLKTAGVEPPAPLTWAPTESRPARAGAIVGLYGGGTLAAEAEAVLAAAGVPADHVEILDLGDDEFTQGRPHPMIDARLRLGHLATTIARTDVGAILLDVVLGHGSLADPAGVLAPTIATATVPVHVALVGTADDPQGRDAQAATLAAAGAHVYLSNAAAAASASAAAAAGATA
ncbi:MAG: FdrA family protein [Actinomycetota bacterium]